MKKILTKERVLKILTAIVISLSVFIILPEQVVMAQEDTTTAADADATTADADATAADADTPDQITLGGTQEITEGMREQVNLIITIQRIANHLLFPVLVMIGGLLDNSMLFGSGMEETLRSIWIPIRNLVNILFVLILVGIALYNVLGIGDENSQYAIKTVLPKLVIGIIAVNFSFLGIKLVLDGVNVLTVSIFSLPNQVSEGLGRIVEYDEQTGAATAESQDTREALCALEMGWSVDKYSGASEEQIKERRETIVYGRLLDLNQVPGRTSALTLEQMKFSWDNHLAGIEEGARGELERDREEQLDSFLCEPGITPRGILTQNGQRFLTRWGHGNAALLMALNMGGIQFFEQLTVDSLGGIIDLLINIILSMILYLVYVVSFIALFIVLLARMVVMWLCIALSPVLILVMAASGLKEKLGGSLSKLSEIFVKNAIAPVMIAIPMTVGWIMLDAIKRTSYFVIGGEGTGTNMGQMMGIPVAGMNDLQQMMVGIGTIAVVWIGVFAAAEGTAAQFITDKVKQYASMAGKYAAATPIRHLPIVPTKGGGETFGQLAFRARQRMSDPFMTQKQREAVGGMTWATVGNASDFARMMQQERNNPEGDVRRSIESLRGARAERIRGELTDARDREAFDRIVGGTGSSADVETLRMSRQLQALQRATTDSAGGAATAGRGRSAPTTLNGGAKIAEGGITVTSDTDTLTTFNANVGKVADAIDKGSAAAAARSIQQGEISIKDSAEAWQALTPGDLQVLIGNDRYRELLEGEYNNDVNQLQTALEQGAATKREEGA